MNMPRILLWLIAPALLAGCASHLKTNPKDAGSAASSTPGGAVVAPSPGGTPREEGKDPRAAIFPDSLVGGQGATADLGMDDLPDLSDSLAAATQARLPSMQELFDYPVVVNRRVLAWVDHYTGKGREGFNRSLKRSGRYLPMARRVFAEEGIPQDLAFLAHIESAFRPDARSRAKAVGLWQFMRGTGRLYGLRCDDYVDERLDPVRSTRACARHLRDLYQRYDDWYLALAAYNAGAGKVDRAIRRAGSRDFWTIAGTRHLVNETRNFVPAILAATILAKSPAAYGLSVEADPPLEFDPVWVDSPTDLRVIARCANRPLSEIEELNPALLRMQTPAKAGRYEVFVPAGSGGLFAQEFPKIPKEERLVFHHHKVGSGDNLGLLARRYGTTVRAIQDANRMGKKTLIRIGQELKIPASGRALALRGSDGPTRHTVRKGQTLAGIARTYRVTMKSLQEANGISNPSRIYAGQVLRIPGPSPQGRGGRQGSETLALLESALVDAAAAVSDEDLGRGASTAHIVEQARERLMAGLDDPAPSAHKDARPEAHLVRRGETLSGIARRHGVRVSDLRRWNRMGLSSLILPGQRLRLSPSEDMADARDPGQKRHVVRDGDTLWSISRQYGVPVSELSRRNGLGRSSTIYPGQTLVVN